MTESKPRSARAVFTLEAARTEILRKAEKGGMKGSGSPVTSKTAEAKRVLYIQALEALESENLIYVDRSKAKPRYFTIQYAPTVAGAAEKMELLAARRHPALQTFPELTKALAANEKLLAGKALEVLVIDRVLVKLLRKTSTVYAHGNSLRTMLGSAPSSEPPVVSISGEAIRQSYQQVVRLTGFPDVEIATLQRQAGVPMAALQDWLLAEHRNGRAVFGIGDWSLANDETRAGVIDMRGDRYLLVRLDI